MEKNIMENSVERILNGLNPDNPESLQQVATDLMAFLKENRSVIITEEEAHQIGVFMHSHMFTHEDRCQIWGALQCNCKNLFAVHPYVEKLLVAGANGESTSGLTCMTLAEMKEMCRKETERKLQEEKKGEAEKRARKEERARKSAKK